MDRPDWVPDDVDMSVPNVARVYDAALGGTHNLPVDREMLLQAQKLFPAVADFAFDNRAFLGRAVRWLAARGVRQFLDIGSGIPAIGNVHEIARVVAPDARVAYVDVDPVAVRHGQQILADDPGAVFVRGDLRQPDDILADPAVAGLLDLSAPVGVLLCAVLHFLPDSDDPAGLVARLRDRLAPGSHVAISHGTRVEEFDAAPMDEIGGLYRRTTMPFFVRSRAEVTAMLDGWELLPPGVVPIGDWHPELGDAVRPQPAILGAVARRS
ncbi:SAM-dependent methyltransferase [Catenuloplanes japonicus]|uniref:SAM-dependent methyltransferase n=1 Tax=Catenuloplanes japonicus TaxID=33876 RepID=UPI000524E825|nr:SAM-dependent methyltransferase [Catenuloplanes japonicus]